MKQNDNSLGLIKNSMQNTTQIHAVDQLSFKTALATLLILVVFMSLMVTGALFFNNQRSSKVISQYDTETQNLIDNNKASIQNLFNEVFPECRQQLLNQQASESAASTYKSMDIVCPAAQATLTEMGANTLKDSSAVAYVRYENGNYELIEASGKYNGPRGILHNQSYSHFHYDQHKRSELNDYLGGHRSIDRWQDFVMYIQGKEVVVPVIIDGETLGYIFRGVIEK